MKNTIKILAAITFVLLSIYIVINLNHKYQNFIIEAETIDDYGTWYIKFENEVNLDNIRSSIKIIDERGKLKEITLNFSDDSKQSIVIKPKEEYEINEKYKLIIDDIYNKNNIKINNFFTEEFNVNMKPLEVINLITDDQYKINLIFNQPIDINERTKESIKVLNSKKTSLNINIVYANNSDKELLIEILDNLIPKEEYTIIVKGEIISKYDNIMLNGINEKFMVERIKLDESLGLGIYETDRKYIDRNYEWYIDQGNTGEHSENNSGPTVGIMAKKWLKKDSIIDVKRAREIYYPDGDEWFLVTLIDFFNEFSVSATVSENINNEDIKKQIDNENIVIAYIDPKYIPYESNEESHVNRFKIEEKKHYIIIKGYIVVDDKLYYEVYDPYNFGSMYKNDKAKGKDRFYYQEGLINSIKNTWNNIVIIPSE